MKSLRARFFVIMMTAVILGWLGWGSSAIIQLFRSQHGLWDQMLIQSADQILYSMPTNIEILGKAPAPNQNVPTSYTRDDITFQVLANGKVIIRSPRAPIEPINPSMKDGFVDVPIKEEIWRTYSISNPARTIQVQVTRRHNPIQDLWTVLSFGIVNILVLGVALALASWWIMRWFLKKLYHVQLEMKEKSAFDFNPIETDSLPKEIRPLVDSFNSLLARVERAVQNERHFLADAAHELRTPLAALSAQAHVTLHAKSEEERTQALHQLSTGVHRCARLSEQLLDLARLDSQKSSQNRDLVDLCELVRIVAHDFEIIAQQRNQHLVIETDSCLFRANVDEIGILLRNLIDNALRFSDDGGTILVLCKNVLIHQQSMIQIKVADHGPGVPPEERDRIFDRFYRVAGSKPRGSGIGLFLVAQIAQSYQATIEIGEGLHDRGFGISILFPSNPA